MDSNITYRVAINYVWEDGYTPDPEIYWLDLEEAVALFDAVLSADNASRTRFTVGLITCSPHREQGIRLRGHYRPQWQQEQLAPNGVFDSTAAALPFDAEPF